jgi:PPM family protein phosphatase
MAPGADGGRAWRGVSRTDPGRVRPSNQDAVTALDDAGLWIVADGMGGHAAGELASRLAVELIATQWQREEDAPQAEADRLRRAIQMADRAIRETARQDPGAAGMGTTVVTVGLARTRPLEAVVAHVGDSRAYLLRDGTLTRLTADHALIEEYVRQGLLSPEAARSHPMRDVLTKALGTGGDSDPEVSTYRLGWTDQILLCTDGLTRMLTDAEILETWLRAGGSADEACRTLVNAALERGGVDNVSVLLIRSDASCPA